MGGGGETDQRNGEDGMERGMQQTGKERRGGGGGKDRKEKKEGGCKVQKWTGEDRSSVRRMCL